MSRRDTIIIAVLVNGGLLAILFLMATHVENERPTPATEQTLDFVDIKEDFIKPVETGATLTPEIKPPVLDEVDLAIESYVSKEAEPTPQEAEDDFIEVTVKRGDFLEKIANANAVTVSAIKQKNNLNSDRLDIGQVLKIPKSTTQIAVPTQSTPDVSEEEWYVVKSGDNPWKIAKKFDVRFDKLLELNNLNEEKARNLRAGDRLRVR